MRDYGIKIGRHGNYEFDSDISPLLFEWENKKGQRCYLFERNAVPNDFLLYVTNTTISDPFDFESSYYYGSILSLRGILIKNNGNIYFKTLYKKISERYKSN